MHSMHESHAGALSFQTSLIWASAYGHLSVVKYLLGLPNCNVDATSNDGWVRSNMTMIMC